MKIYEALSLVFSLIAVWISIKAYRLKMPQSKLAEKQLSKIIKDETESELIVDITHSPYDEHQDIMIKNIGSIPAHNINIYFEPPINFIKPDKEKFDKKFPCKILYPGKSIFFQYQYHIYGKKDYFNISLEWNDPSGKSKSKNFHLL